MGGDVAEQSVVFPKRHHQEGSDTRHDEVHDQMGVGARTGSRYSGGAFRRWSRVTSHIRDVDQPFPVQQPILRTVKIGAERLAQRSANASGIPWVATAQKFPRS